MPSTLVVDLVLKETHGGPVRPFVAGGVVFDRYSQRARIAPLVVTLLPLVVLVLAALPGLRTVDRGVGLVLLLVVVPLLDQFGRARGRRLEPLLFDRWGGRPTTQLLHWHGPVPETEQAARHAALQRISGLRLPTPAEEAERAHDADARYEAAVRVLRTLTTADPGAALVFTENCNYGFRRNLLGLRVWGLLVAAGSLLASIGWASSGAALAPAVGSAAVAALCLVLWLTIVRDGWVREAAWIYAERLLEQVTRLDPGHPLGPDRREMAARPARAQIDGGSQACPTIAVLTALASEFAAVSAVLRQPRELVTSPLGDPNQYRVGTLPSRDPDRPHQVVAAVLPHDGNRAAAAIVTDLLRSFPTISCVVFSGIAGGIPDLDHPRLHVRLGDVLVAVDGIVDYDHTWTMDGEEHLRRHLQGLSVDMLRAVQELRATYADAGEAVTEELDQVRDPRFARPPALTDRIMRDGRPTAHPDDTESGRVCERPKVHFGAIGSADRLLLDARLRDRLAGRHNIKGVEMEASGLAVGASLRGVPWFVVRGVVDYCDNLTKDDVWHNYASLTSAAFVAAMLARCRPLSRADASR